MTDENKQINGTDEVLIGEGWTSNDAGAVVNHEPELMPTPNEVDTDDPDASNVTPDSGKAGAFLGGTTSVGGEDDEDNTPVE